MVNIFIKNECPECQMRTPLMDFGILIEKKFKCGVIYILGNILSFPDVAENLETNLYRLIELGEMTNIAELIEMAHSALDILQDVIFKLIY